MVVREVILVSMLGSIVACCPVIAADLNGKWRSETGAVYAISQRGNNVLGVYSAPNNDQSEGGIMPGDIAFSGVLTDDFVVATFYQRFPLKKVPACAASWFEVSTIYFQFDGPSDTLKGDLLRSHVDDDCKIDKHWLQPLLLKRE